MTLEAPSGVRAAANGRQQDIASFRDRIWECEKLLIRLAAGSFFALLPAWLHYAHFGQETVLQINTIGFRGHNYVNPKDDPRQKTQ